MELYNNDAEYILKTLKSNSIDMVMTSPPYDNIKNYNNSLNWTFDKFKAIANELYRTIKEGGVVVWVVADQTKNGSESGTSFKQALYFKDIGFNLHDTMIFKKLNYLPLTHNRYEQEFEYMFCFSKGKPKTFNPIKIPSKNAGKKAAANVFKTTDDDTTRVDYTVNDTHIKGNIFEYATGNNKKGEYKHPAMFPYNLAKDQILTWTNKNDIVLDPFMGSGTTGKVCIDTERTFIGIELEQKYFSMCLERFSKNKYSDLE